MRIGIFTETYTPYVSGVVTSIMMLKKSLEDLGHDVYVVTINQDRLKYEYDEKESKWTSVQLNQHGPVKIRNLAKIFNYIHI